MNAPLPLRSIQGSKSTPIPSSNKEMLFKPPIQHSATSPQLMSIPNKDHVRTSTSSSRTTVPRVDVLRESRLHQTFEYKAPPQARLRSHRVGYAVYGPSHGHPVFVIGGYGCTRMVGIMFEELAYRYQLKMIWPERPGYGLSEECNSQKMTALEWADVIIQLSDQLKIDQFSMIAQSVGSVFALAVAYQFPRRVLGPIFLISPWVSTQLAGTFKWTRRLPAPLVAKTVSLALDVMWMFNRTSNTTIHSTRTSLEDEKRIDYTQTIHTHQESNKKVRRTTVAFEEDELLASLEEEMPDLTTDFPTDRPLRHFVRPKHMSLYLAMNNYRMSENYSQGQLCDVMVALEKYHLFGFNYSDVKTSVSAVWGDKDGLIPSTVIDVLANSFHDVRLKILESEGHDLVWKEGVMEWAIRGIAQKIKPYI